MIYQNDKDAHPTIRKYCRYNSFMAELQKHLSSTDWYIIRSQETKKSAPKEIVESRQAARDRISELRGGA